VDYIREKVNAIKRTTGERKVYAAHVISIIILSGRDKNQKKAQYVHNIIPRQIVYNNTFDINDLSLFMVLSPPHLYDNL
jgi:hypothetical protein